MIGVRNNNCRRVCAAFFLWLLCCPMGYLTANPNDSLAGVNGSREGWKKYLPSLNGEVKARFEWNTNGETARFAVRNARLRFNGYVSPLVSYRFFLDFNDKGNITILDTYVVIKPGQFEFVLGQQRADLDRSVNPYFFANRSFLIKFLPTHYAVHYDGTASVRIQGWRDIGLQVGYTFRGASAPVRVAVGAFNGAGMNRPDWSDRFSYVVRLEYGERMNGLHCKGWYYNGWLGALGRREIAGDGVTVVEEKYRQKVQMTAVGAYYAHKRMYFEGEYGARWSDNEASRKTVHVGYLQGIYAFPFRKKKMLFKYIAPALRWDIGTNIAFQNQGNAALDMFSGNRLTFGLNFGFIEKIMVSELRLDYEQFLFREKPLDIGCNHLLQDKLTLELCIQF